MSNTETIIDITDSALAEAAEVQALEALNEARIEDAYEVLKSPEAAWAQEVLEKLDHLTDSDILMDLDGTIYHGGLEGEEWGELRPGTTALLTVLTLDPNRRNRVHLWSRQSSKHAEGVAHKFNLNQQGLVAGYHTKPFFVERDGETILCGPNDLKMEYVEQTVGFTPAAAVDNETEDRIIDAPAEVNIKVDNFYIHDREPVAAT